MKVNKITIWFSILIAIIFCIAGCGKENTAKIDQDQTSSRNVFSRTYSAMADSSSDGIYVQTLMPIPDLFYMDRASGKIVFLCGKADCEHGKEGNTDCNAYFEEDLIRDSIQRVDDKLYVLGQPTKEHNSVLYRMDLDGSNREAVTTINAEAGAGGTRVIGKNMYYIGVPDAGDFSVFHMYRQSIEDKSEPAEDIFPVDEEEWSARRIEEFYLDEENELIYIAENKYTEDLKYEGSIWKYDIKDETWEEIFSDTRFFTWFLDGEWFYYSEYTGGADDSGNLIRIEVVTCDPVKRKNLKTGEEETTTIPGGFLEGYDGNYCYMRTYGEKAGDGLKSIDVYTLDGTMVTSIKSPVEDYQYNDAVNVGVTYDAIVIHHSPSTSEAYVSENIYLYDKKNITEQKGDWEKIYINLLYDENSNTLDLHVKQK